MAEVVPEEARSEQVEAQMAVDLCKIDKVMFVSRINTCPIPGVPLLVVHHRGER